jgi:hypothetical protein
MDLRRLRRIALQIEEDNGIAKCEMNVERGADDYVT